MAYGHKVRAGGLPDEARVLPDWEEVSGSCEGRFRGRAQRGREGAVL